jgi:MOSC domain-containing protein YiiM
VVNDLPAVACHLLAVLAGKARPFGPEGHRSGIDKAPCSSRVYVDTSGLSGDEQGDRRHHGGVEKAIHHYAFEHYAAWKQDLPASSDHFDRPGTFGENFSSVGMTESSVCIGDVYLVGRATLEVSQARQPCWKLNVRTGVPDMAAKVQETGRTGWYYRVLRPGWVQAGDTLLLLSRPNPEWPLRRLLHCLYVDRLNRAALTQVVALTALTPSWRRLAEARLERNIVEDWSSRLSSPR